MQQALILASSSVYRRALLQKLQIPFECVAPSVDETPLPQEKPQQTALRLAQAKARKVAETHPNALIIGCDQVAMLDDLQLGKPITHQNAIKQLQLMRGREVVFYSALCLYNAKTKHMQTEIVPYMVEFIDFSDAEIDNYLHKDQPYDCAGSAKSEGLGIAIIKRMVGEDPNALVGLPLIKLVQMLKNEHLPVI